MSILKRNFLIASVIYVLFYLGPILVNPLAMLNIAEAGTVGLLVFGGFYLSYIFLYTNKAKLREQTKNTIITLIVMLMSLIISDSDILYNRQNAFSSMALAAFTLLYISKSLKITSKVNS